jgi:hypothetical protein
MSSSPANPITTISPLTSPSSLDAGSFFSMPQLICPSCQTEQVNIRPAQSLFIQYTCQTPTCPMFQRTVTVEKSVMQVLIVDEGFGG